MLYKCVCEEAQKFGSSFGRTKRTGNVPPIPQPTSVKAESTFNPLPSHRLLDASRRYPAREVVDFWKGPIPVPDPEVSAPEEDRVDCDCWSWEGEDARIIRRACHGHQQPN
jgi:hypothetical protein